MKIENIDEKVVIYLYRYFLSYDDKDKLNQEIKNIFLKLIKIYNYDFFGFNKVTIYENKIYGCIIEIEKIYSDSLYQDIIDLKVVVYNNVSFYFEFDDYIFPFYNKDIVKNNNKYYIKIDNSKKLYKYLEYGKIIYKNDMLN